MPFNKVILMGNLVRDPESKALPSGGVVVNCGIAVTEKWTDKSTNTKREEVCFVDINMFGKTADNFIKHFSKGNAVLIEGRLKQDLWESDGNKRSKHRVQVDKWSFPPSPNKSNDGFGDDEDAF